MFGRAQTKSQDNILPGRNATPRTAESKVAFPAARYRRRELPTSLHEIIGIMSEWNIHREAERKMSNAGGFLNSVAGGII